MMNFRISNKIFQQSYLCLFLVLILPNYFLKHPIRIFLCIRSFQALSPRNTVYDAAHRLACRPHVCVLSKVVFIVLPWPHFALTCPCQTYQNDSHAASLFYLSTPQAFPKMGLHRGHYMLRL